MYRKPSTHAQRSLFWDLESALDCKNPLYILANRIDWDVFEKAFSSLYCHNNGRPAKPIRLMVGLVILKHLRNVSDEVLVQQFRENVYYQYFCGMECFSVQPPCTASELTHFRRRIKEEGVELILKESVRVNVALEDGRREREGKGKGGRKSADSTTAFIDSTVQEKNVTHPTDAKLLDKVIRNCLKIAAKEGKKLRRTYADELDKLRKDQRFRGRGKKKGKEKCTAAADAADRRMREIAGELVRELLRKLPPESASREKLELCLKLVNEEKIDGHKIYSLHEPDVVCISKGKQFKKHEFGNKVSILRLFNGVIIAAVSFRNEYDGHTIDKTMEQAERVYGGEIRQVVGDRGYRGQKWTFGAQVLIPDIPKASDTAYMKREKKRLFRKRAGIEPVIGHCKSDHRLGRNYYKGLYGDSINAMLAAAAYNFKRVMNILLRLFRALIFCLLRAWNPAPALRPAQFSPASHPHLLAGSGF